MPDGKYKTIQQTETITSQLGSPSCTPSPPNHYLYITEGFSKRLVKLFSLIKAIRGSMEGLTGLFAKYLTQEFNVILHIANTGYPQKPSSRKSP